MSTNISIEDIDRYVVYLEARKEFEKSHELTKIRISAVINTGLYYYGSFYTNKCFFISLANGINKSTSNTDVVVDPLVHELMECAKFTDSKLLDTMVTIMDHNDKDNWQPHRAQIESMCKTHRLLSKYRIEIYYGTRTNTRTDTHEILTTDPFPVLVFNPEIYCPDHVIRIVQLPDHYNYIESKSDFFHPRLLTMTTEEIDALQNYIVIEQDKLFKSIQCEKDLAYAKKLQEEEKQYQQSDDLSEELARKLRLEEENKYQYNLSNRDGRSGQVLAPVGYNKIPSIKAYYQ